LKLLTSKGIQDFDAEHVDHGASTQPEIAYPDAPTHVHLALADVGCAAADDVEDYVASNHPDHFEEDWT